MRSDALFAYGTLVFPEVFEAVTGRALPSAEAFLSDWTALRLRGAVYPGLRREPGARTPGRVYSGVDAATWERLDAFEGDLYEVVPVEVASAGRARPAATYAVAARGLERLGAEPWDARAFRDLHLDAFLDACRRFAAGAAPGPP